MFLRLSSIIVILDLQILLPIPRQAFLALLIGSWLAMFLSRFGYRVGAHRPRPGQVRQTPQPLPTGAGAARIDATLCYCL